MPSTTLQKPEIALMQLDRAITLYLDERDFVSAITLGRASHELIRQLGEALTGKPDTTVDDFAELVVAIAQQDGDVVASREIVDRTFYFPNQLKHHGANDSLSLNADWDIEAMDMIKLATSAWFAAFAMLSEEMIRFDQADKA